MSSSQRRRVAYSQNFLHSRALVAALVDRSSLGVNDVVLEIGSGKGIITEALAQRCRHVLTIEKDPLLAETMRRRFGNQPNVTVFTCDILDFPLPETPFKVFASIPYRITTAIVAKLTSGLAPPNDAYLVVQREAAIKFAGMGGESMLSVRLKPWFDVSIEYAFRRRDFSPRPTVDSVLLHIAKRDVPLLRWDKRDRFGHLVEAIFSAWQPTAEQALRKLLPKSRAVHALRNVNGTLAVRPSDVSAETWLELFRALDDERYAESWKLLASASAKLRVQQATLQRPTRTRVSSTNRARQKRSSR